MCRFFPSVLLLSLVCLTIPAHATDYIGISVANVDSDAVRRVWQDDGINRTLKVGVMGGLEFEIAATSSYPEDTVSSWIYIDGITTSGQTRSFAVNTYRLLHCCVVFKYDDNTYEKREFDILPVWEISDDASPAPGALVPLYTDTVFDITACQLIANTVSEEINGPTSEQMHLACKDEACSSFKNVDKDECQTDFDCIDKF